LEVYTKERTERTPAYGVYTSQLVQYARCCSFYQNFL